MDRHHTEEVVVATAAADPELEMSCSPDYGYRAHQTVQTNAGVAQALVRKGFLGPCQQASPAPKITMHCLWGSLSQSWRPEEVRIMLNYLQRHQVKT